MELASLGFIYLAGNGAVSLVGSLQSRMDKVWIRVYGPPRKKVPKQPMTFKYLCLMCHCFVLGTPWIFKSLSKRMLKKLVWANCRTGNTSQLCFLMAGIMPLAFGAYYWASRPLNRMRKQLEALMELRKAVKVAKASINVDEVDGDSVAALFERVL